jgi:hypothetical protein
MAFPYRTTGSLAPTYVSARLVGLAVKHAYALTLLQVLALASCAYHFPYDLSIPYEVL